MSSPPDLPAFCLSDTAVRVDDTIQTTLLGIEQVLSIFGGTVAERHPYALTVKVCGIEVQASAFRVLGSDYLEVGAKAGSIIRRPSGAHCWHQSDVVVDSAVPSPPVLGTPMPKPPKMAPPPPPKRVPAMDPLKVTPLSLDAEAAWEAVDGIAGWPKEELQDFAAAHQDICLLHSRCALEPRVFEQHMHRLPAQVRKGLKWWSRRWNILPPNITTLLDQVSMICAEGEAFWILHGC